MNISTHSSAIFQKIREEGPWPFITRIHYKHPQWGLFVWNSRDHRKGFLLNARSTAWLWKPQDLNWWIGMVFALGASFFMLASLICLFPALNISGSLSSSQINSLFFLGSIPFTTAAYLQLFQAANAGVFSTNGIQKGKWQLIGWKPKEIGWLSSVLQFIGTLLFNVNTFQAIAPPNDWMQQDLWIWIPDFLGSVFFLISGYLAYMEVGHRHFSFRIKEVSWWIGFINLLGCIAFMISAFYAFIPPQNLNEKHITLSIVFTLIGAFCFWLGAVLMLPENAKSGSR